MKQPAIYIFGEVLYDSFPGGKQVLGGAPFNVAWHCHAFGLAPYFISRVGEDAAGDQVIEKMKGWGMDCRGINKDSQYQTGVVKVSITDGEPSYEITSNVAWDFIEAGDIPNLAENCLLYHGSLALRSESNQHALRAIMNKLEPTVFVDVNLRDPWWQQQQVKQMMSASTWVKINEHELNRVTNSNLPVKQVMANVIESNQLDVLIVTRGEAGAILMDAKGNCYEDRPRPCKQLVDTVGAGDAFSSIFLVGQYYQWSMQQTLTRALEFARAVVGLRGATTENQDFYQPFIQQWDIPVNH